MSWIAVATIGAGAIGGITASRAGSQNAAAIRDAANTQGESNIELAKTQNLLNNPNIKSFLGSQTYTMGEDGRPILTQTLSPAEQAKYEKQGALQGSLLDLAQNNMPALQEMLKGSWGLPGGPQTSFAAGQVPTSLDFSKAPGMPSADARVLQQVEDAMYGQGAQYLDPQYKQMESEMRSRLANQGITTGSEASNQELENFRLGKQKAYGDLSDRSILSGQEAMKNLYGMALAGRQQGVSEATAQGQFGQSGVGLAAQIAQAQMAASNAARAQAYGEYTSNKTGPFNMMMGLMSGGQVNSPQFAANTPTTIQGAPIFQGAVAGAQANQAGFNAGANVIGQSLGTAAHFLPGYNANKPFSWGWPGGSGGTMPYADWGSGTMGGM